MDIKPKVMVVDDEEDIRFSLRGILEDEGYEVLEAESGESAQDQLSRQGVDLVFLDIWLPGIDGLTVLQRLEEESANIPVVMISGHGNIETAVRAIKLGAHDFIEKPLSLEKVVITAQKALEFRTLQQENLTLRARVRSEGVQEITGTTSPAQQLRQQIASVAPTDAWVLIHGENGTGKEIVARSIHNKSRRSEHLLVAVNCAAIPEELIESELFGHEKGSFTGATQSQPGKFELAHRGTLFLDEIADMSLKTQAKILRILQEQSFERVGGRRTIRVDVRVVAATNKDLDSEIREGRFREDLYYRLKVFPIEVPPLRERAGDIPLLVGDFVEGMVREHGFKPVAFTPEAMEALKEYPWPGNVRELKNFVERMLIIARGKTVDVDLLPPEVLQTSSGARIPRAVAHPLGEEDFKSARAAFERLFLEEKLREFKGNVSRMAESIGLERSYLYRKFKAYGIQV